MFNQSIRVLQIISNDKAIQFDFTLTGNEFYANLYRDNFILLLIIVCIMDIYHTLSLQMEIILKINSIINIYFVFQIVIIY